jgi:hypothetical protein
VTFGSLCSCFTHNNEISINTSCLFQNYVLQMLRTMHATVKDTPSADDDHPTKLIRSTILTWACNFNSPICLESASKQFKQWMDNTDNKNP